MTELSVRISEETTRPMGYAVITLTGIPKNLATAELALSRHGYAANNLGPDGWQGAECWLQPEEAWYSGESFKVVIGPDLVYQLENMPYALEIRGQGLMHNLRTTFIWPLELEIEETAETEREPVGGTRVHPRPTDRPVDIQTAAAPEPEKLDLPDIGAADMPIPTLDIPDYGPTADALEDDEPSTPEPALAVTQPEEPPLSQPQAPEPASKAQPPASVSVTPKEAPTPPRQQEPKPQKEPTAPTPAAESVQRRGKGMIVAAVVVVGLLIAGGVGWLLFGKGGEDTVAADTTAPASPTPETSAPPDTATAEPKTAVAPVVPPGPMAPSTTSTGTTQQSPQPEPLLEPAMPAEPTSPPVAVTETAQPELKPRRTSEPEATSPSTVTETARPEPAPEPQRTSREPTPSAEGSVESALESEFGGVGDLESSLESMLEKQDQ